MGRSVSSAALFLGLVACGGTTGSPPPRADAGDVEPRSDAMPQNVCTVLEESYADQGAHSGTAVILPIDDTDPEGPKYITLQIPLNAESPPDVLFLELWSDSVPFDEGGFAPVSLTLNGDQGDLIQCGACAYIAADYQEGQDRAFHMAYTGELVIDTFDPAPETGRIAGRMDMVKFQEVTVDEAGQEPVEGGCKSELAGVSFDFEIAEPSPE